MSRLSLHKSQQQLLELLAAPSEEPLTVRELQERIGASSTSVVVHHLQQFSHLRTERLKAPP